MQRTLKEPKLSALGTPTQAPPGSEEKVQVLETRYSLGKQLWHPDDAGHESYDNGEYTPLRPNHK